MVNSKNTLFNFLSKTFLISLTYWLISTAAHAANALQEVLEDPRRDLTDKIKDQYNHPLSVIEFCEIATGMTVLDIYTADGYWISLLAATVGPSGKIFAQNSPSALAYQVDRTDTSAGDVLSGKLARLEITNVTRLDIPMRELTINKHSLDRIFLSKIFHDYYNRSPQASMRMLLKTKEWLKPDGVLCLIDHHGKQHADNRRLHRIYYPNVTTQLNQAGFEITKESGLLRNPKDNYAESIFSPRLNGFTDRFLIKATLTD